MAHAKYHKGAAVPSLAALVTAIENNQPLFLAHKIQNAAWMQNMTVCTLKGFVYRQQAFYAEKEADNGKK